MLPRKLFCGGIKKTRKSYLFLFDNLLDIFRMKSNIKVMKEAIQVNLNEYNSTFSFSNKVGRLLWNISYIIFFRPFNLSIFDNWRVLVLRIFGAKIGQNVTVYASAKIWAPWNLVIGSHSSIGPKVDCYNQGRITIGNHTVISQKSYLCASSHDYKIFNFPLVLRPIEINDEVWVAAGAFIGPGVELKKGCVVGARAAVFKNVKEFSVVGGNPAQFIKKRVIQDERNF